MSFYTYAEPDELYKNVHNETSSWDKESRKFIQTVGQFAHGFVIIKNEKFVEMSMF